MMLDGVNLLVELLLARNKRQSFTDRRDHAQEERGLNELRQTCSGSSLLKTSPN